jgi:hypothetical protein
LSQPVASLTNVVVVIVVIIMIMTPREHAVAGLAEDVGKALLLFAERLRAGDDSTAAAATGGVAPQGARLGGTQAALLDVVRAAGTEGVTSREAGERVSVASSNATRALKGLHEKGLIAAADSTPVVWTLA